MRNLFKVKKKDTRMTPTSCQTCLFQYYLLIKNMEGCIDDGNASIHRESNTKLRRPS